MSLPRLITYVSNQIQNFYSEPRIGYSDSEKSEMDLAVWDWSVEVLKGIDPFKASQFVHDKYRLPDPETHTSDDGDLIVSTISTQQMMCYLIDDFIEEYAEGE